jgi:hypothetical protein
MELSRGVQQRIDAMLSKEHRGEEVEHMRSLYAAAEQEEATGRTWSLEGGCEVWSNSVGRKRKVPAHLIVSGIKEWSA